MFSRTRGIPGRWQEFKDNLIIYALVGSIFVPLAGIAWALWMLASWPGLVLALSLEYLWYLHELSRK